MLEIKIGTLYFLHACLSVIFKKRWIGFVPSNFYADGNYANFSKNVNFSVPVVLTQGQTY